MRTTKNNIVFKNIRDSKIHFSVHLAKSLLSLLHLCVAKGKVFNLLKTKGIIAPNLIELTGGFNEMMLGKPRPQYLEIRSSSVNAGDHYYLSTKICLVIITLLA